MFWETFYDQPLSYGSFSTIISAVFWIKKNKSILKIISSKKKFPYLQKVPKNKVPNAIARNLS